VWPWCILLSSLPIPLNSEKSYCYKIPSFHAKSQVLKIHKCEKNFKMFHNKESHKVEVLARIYFV
jgi:hypothetical protein